PPPHPDQPAHQAEDHASTGQDAENVARDFSAPLAGGVEEGVGIEASRGVGYVGQGEVEGEDEDDEGEVEGRWRGSAGEEDFEEGEDSIEGVNGDLGVRGVAVSYLLVKGVRGRAAEKRKKKECRGLTFDHVTKMLRDEENSTAQKTTVTKIGNVTTVV
ncbi:MAG: hypothetical protein Q9187_007002, partial [Circinaria calcarea]